MDILQGLLSGLGTTLFLTAISLCLGTVLGLVIALARMSRLRAVSGAAAALISTVLAIPALVQLFFLYYTLPIVTGLRLSGTVTLILALTISFSVFMAEIYRSGLQAVPRGQWEAARVLGLNRRVAFRHVVLPQAIRLVVPPICSATIILLKESSLATFIGVNDLLNVGQQVAVNTFRPVPVLSAIALAYFVLTYPISLAATRLERVWVARSLAAASPR